MIKEWSAPGKLILVGEYAVLYGAQALVTAVDRYCRIQAELVPGAYSKFAARNIKHSDFEFRIESNGAVNASQPVTDQSAFARAVIQHIAGFLRENGIPFSTCSLSADTSDFYRSESGDKLGLGSSAAFTVCLVQTLLDLHGYKADKEHVFLLASQVHHAAQGKKGSGIDIAASTFGGTCKYSIRQMPDRVVPIGPDESIKIVTVWSGEPASTTSMISALSAFEKNEPEIFNRLIAELGRISARTIKHYCDKESELFLKEIGNYTGQLDELGKYAHIPIISDSHREIAEIAAEFDAAYKPSGAGGGDIGTAFFTDARKCTAFINRIRSGPFQLIDLKTNVSV